MDNLKEMLERQVAEKIFTSLYVKYYQDSEHQDIEKLVNDAINAAIIFSQKYIQKQQNVDKDKTIVSSWIKK